MTQFLVQYWLLLSIVWIVMGIFYYTANGSTGTRQAAGFLLWGIFWPFIFVAKIMARIAR